MSASNEEYLPLSGGTMVGTIYFKDASISNIPGQGIEFDSTKAVSFANDTHVTAGALYVDNGSVEADTYVKAQAIVKRGGTSSQFLKADGTVDDRTYIEQGAIVTDIRTVNF